MAFSDRKTLLRFRATCKTLKFQAHQTLHNGCLHIEVEGSFIDRRSLSPEYEVGYPHYPPSWAPKTPTVVMWSGTGALPFRTEEDWAWACAHSDAVEIDSAVLAASSCVAPHAKQGVVVRKHSPDTRKSSPKFPSRPVPSTADSVTIQAGLLRALRHIPRSAVVTIDHSGSRGAQGTPVCLPPTDSLVLLLNPRCNCLLFEGDPMRKRPLPPAHSAKHITLRVPSGRDESHSRGDENDPYYGEMHSDGSGEDSHGDGSEWDSDEDDSYGSGSDSDDDGYCQLTCALLWPSVELLTLSVDKHIDQFHIFDYLFIFVAFNGGPGKSLRKVEIELRRGSVPIEDKARKEAALKREWASCFPFDADQVHITYSDEARRRR